MLIYLLLFESQYPKLVLVVSKCPRQTEPSVSQEVAWQSLAPVLQLCPRLPHDRVSRWCVCAHVVTVQKHCFDMSLAWLLLRKRKYEFYKLHAAGREMLLLALGSDVCIGFLELL